MNNKQLRHLRALGHHLEPCLLLGKQGITPNVIKQLVQSLKAHELIKLKLPQLEEEERKEMAASLAQDTQSKLVQILGRTVLLYRRNPQQPKIDLPA